MSEYRDDPIDPGLDRENPDPDQVNRPADNSRLGLPSSAEDEDVWATAADGATDFLGLEQDLQARPIGDVQDVFHVPEEERSAVQDIFTGDATEEDDQDSWLLDLDGESEPESPEEAFDEELVAAGAGAGVAASRGKPLFALVALALVAALGYIGWERFLAPAPPADSGPVAVAPQSGPVNPPQVEPKAPTEAPTPEAVITEETDRLVGMGRQPESGEATEPAPTIEPAVPAEPATTGEVVAEVEPGDFATEPGMTPSEPGGSPMERFVWTATPMQPPISTPLEATLFTHLARTGSALPMDQALPLDPSLPGIPRVQTPTAEERLAEETARILAAGEGPASTPADSGTQVQKGPTFRDWPTPTAREPYRPQFDPNAAPTGLIVNQGDASSESQHPVTGLISPKLQAGVRVASMEDLRGIWPAETVPTDAIHVDQRLLTPHVGRVRAILRSGEVFEGRLFAVGRGQIWLESSLGRMSLDSARLTHIDRLAGSDSSTVLGDRGTEYMTGLPRVRIKVPGGSFFGKVIASSEEHVTLVTDRGARVKLDRDEIEVEGNLQTVVIKAVAENASSTSEEE